MLERGRGHTEFLDRAENRNGGRNHAVSVEQRRSEKLRLADQDGAVAALHQGEDGAFGFVVCAHHADEILQRDDDDDRPAAEEENTEDVVAADADRGRCRGIVPISP